MLKKAYSALRNRFSLFSIVVFYLFVIAVLFHIAFLLFPQFADLFNRYPSSVLRAFLSYLTYLLPFSLAETVVLFLPFAVIGLILWSIKIMGVEDNKSQKEIETLSDEELYALEGRIRQAEKRSVRHLGNLFAAVVLFYIAFVLTFAPAYQGATLDQKLDIPRNKVSAEELYRTAKILADKMDGLLDEIPFCEQGASVMPYSFDEMNDELNEAYRKASERYGFLPILTSRLKPIAASEPMTYTHISGVYSYYTGEANININYPDYTIPFTAAHEMAHQRGIGREEEASFTAFLVCNESDDPYIRYSAYLSVYEYLTSALYSASPELYSDLLAAVDLRIRYDQVAFSKFFQRYEDSAASKISGAVNDTYLKLQGQTEGKKSYNLVVDLAVAYYIGGTE